MQLGKRKQILMYREIYKPGPFKPPYFIAEHIVKVLSVGHSPANTSWKRRGCKVIGLARNIILNSRSWNSWNMSSIAPDREWRIVPHRIKAVLIDVNQLPLYLHWERGVAFNKVLKGEL